MRYLVEVSFLCALAISGAFAQGDRGTITGTVTDPTGAIIPGVKVTAENIAGDSQRPGDGHHQHGKFHLGSGTRRIVERCR